MTTADTRAYPAGLAAITWSLVATAIGAVYYLYLYTTPFPPDWVRIIPVVWISTALVAIALGLRAILANSAWLLGGIAALIGLLNLPLAVIFAIAAAFGD